MHRWILSCLILGLALLSMQPARGRDDKPAKEASKADKAFDELMKDYTAANEEVNSRAAFEKLGKEYAPKFYEHAKANAGEKSSLKALGLVLQLTKPGADGPRKGAVALLNKDYIKHADIKDQLKTLTGSLNSYDLECGKIIKAISKDHPDKTTKALACKALINMCEQLIDLGEQMKSNEKLKETVAKVLGKENAKALIDGEAGFKKDKEDALAKFRGELKGLVPDLFVGATVPATTAETLDGKPVKLSDLKGKVVVLDFWATWCGPCIQMIPENSKLVKDMEKRPFVFVSLSVDAKKDTVVKFQKKTEMPWAQWWVGPTGKVLETWEVKGYPTVYVVDHKGIIRFHQVGFNPTSDKFAKEVEKLVKAAEADKKDSK